MSIMRWTSAVLVCLSLAACGSGQTSLSKAPPLTNPSSAAAITWPLALPRDGVQPWEQLDAAGHVQPKSRGVSLAGAPSVFSSGVHTFINGGTVGVNGEASELTSGVAGGGGLSFCIYRLTLGGDQPGMVAVDANLVSGGSSYYVGLSNFASNTWQWRGPFTCNAIRLAKLPGQLDSANYLSPLGDMFVSVVAFNGSSVDVIGVGAEPVPAGDVTAPAAPTSFTATPDLGGLLIEWLPSADPDIAGYNVLWSNSGFSADTDNGVKRYAYCEGGRRLFLNMEPRLTFVAVEAVDLAGNISPLTVVHNNVPGGGTPLPLVVKTSPPSGGLSTKITLNATGATKYDFDLDGDGNFEVTGKYSGVLDADTSTLGLHRVHIRAHGTAATDVAFGGATLIVTGNSAPVVTADANPTFGLTPLPVVFTGSAHDEEEPNSSLTFAWDFDGDGIYESGTDTLTPQHTYKKPGVYNATFQAMDSLGATGTASVPLQVSKGPNQTPTASFHVSALQATKPMVLSFSFDGSSSDDPDGDPMTAHWDFDGTGLGGGVPYDQLMNHIYTQTGTYTATLQVADDSNATDAVSHTVYVPSVCNTIYGVPNTFTRQSPIVGAQTNDVTWIYRTSSFNISTPVIGPLGTVYVGCADGKVYALAPNGTSSPSVKWRFTAGDAFNSSPAVGLDGVVYAGSSDHNIYALEDKGATSPSVKWSFNTGGAILSSPVLGPDGTVYVASDDDTLYALVDNGTATPDVKWSFTTGSAIDSCPAIAPDGTVYIGSYDRNIYALTDNGSPTPTVKWSYLTGGAVVSSPAIGPDGTVYVGSFDKTLYALKDNGSPTPTVKWTYLTGGGVFSSPAIGTDGTVYIGSEDDYVYALTDNGSATPTVKWSFHTGDQILASSPTIGADGTVYIGSSDKKVYALISDGSATPAIKWSFTTGDVVYGSLSIGLDGRVYAAGEDHYVYAFGH